MPSELVFGEEVQHTTMDRWIGTTALVTGASSGIGKAICEVLVKLGVNVVGVARRTELIQEQAMKLCDERGKLYARRCDLRNEHELDDLFTWVEDNLGPIAILVNNAGLIKPTTLIDGDTDDWRVQFDVNNMALLICTKKAIASMKAHRQDGHIVNISSITGHYLPEMSIPCMNVYGATKHALTAITEQLRRELRAVKDPLIKISSISPGLVKTEFINNFTDEGGLRDIMKELPGLYPLDIADTLIYILSTPPHVQIHDVIIKVTGEAF